MDTAQSQRMMEKAEELTRRLTVVEQRRVMPTSAANVAALATTLILGAAAWALTRDATPYYALNLVGAVLVWGLLVSLTVAFGAQLAKAFKQEQS